MVKREHITLSGFRKVLTYKASAKKGLEAKILASSSDLFKDITPHNVENVYVPDSQSILEPEYVSGFVAADGTFLFLNLRSYLPHPPSESPSPSGRRGSDEKTKWPNYDATFSLAQNERDEALLYRIIKILGCGSIKKIVTGCAIFMHEIKKELAGYAYYKKIIVPFFTKYDIHTEKRRDFLNFASGVSIRWLLATPTTPIRPSFFRNEVTPP